MPERVYIIHISVCRNKITCIRIVVFCKIADGQLVPLPWKQKKYKHFEFFIYGICKSDMGYLDTIYVIHIQLCCKKIFRFEKGQFLKF